MDDDFLYKLRVDPPSSFAVHLKARLDRGSNPARRIVTWSLTLLLCGTAFALSLPQMRQSILRLFTVAPDSARPAIVLSPSSAAANHAAASDRSAVPEPATPAAGSNSSGSRKRPAPSSFASNSNLIGQAPPAPETANADAAAANSPPVPAPIVVPRIISLMAGPGAGQTPEEMARQAAASRRGLFQVLSWAAAPLLPIAKGQTPIDAQTAATAAIRIQSLTGMIAEVYAIDTRPFAVETRSSGKIWTDMRGFDSKIDELAQAAYTLNAAAQRGDEQAIQQAASQVGMACSGCHAAYRTPAGDGQP